MADDYLRQAMRTLIEDTLKIVERVLAAQAITNKPGVKITQGADRKPRVEVHAYANEIGEAGELAKTEYLRLVESLDEPKADDTEMHWLASIGHIVVERHGVEYARTLVDQADTDSVSP